MSTAACSRRGHSVPGLFAAGRTTAGIAADGYVSGISLGDGSFFGPAGPDAAAWRGTCRGPDPGIRTTGPDLPMRYPFWAPGQETRELPMGRDVGGVSARPRKTKGTRRAPAFTPDSRRSRAQRLPARTEVGADARRAMMISILAVVMSGLALSIGVDYKAVALAVFPPGRRVDREPTAQARDVDYDTMALSSAPAQHQHHQPGLHVTRRPDPGRPTTSPAAGPAGADHPAPQRPVDHVETPVR
jgi:hypothetical protein